MTPERRKQPRLKLGHLAYIHVEPDGGAIVLDVSDGGIGFHSVAPFHQMGTICIRFSLQARKHLTVSGNIAWVDQTQKRGGLKFSDLSPDLRSEIQTRLVTAPLRSKKQPVLSLAETNQNVQETELQAQTPSISLPQPFEAPRVEIYNRQRVTPAAAQPRRRRLRGHWWVVAGPFVASGLAAIFLLCPYRVQITSGILFPGSQSTIGTKYLELKGFSDLGTAQSAADMLANKGLPVLLVHKDFLWMSFDTILIGPYLIETDLAQLHGTLQSEGFSVVPRTWSQVTRLPLLDNYLNEGITKGPIRALVRAICMFPDRIRVFK